jgi:Membrane proteins related to metalloendopeptidases
MAKRRRKQKFTHKVAQKIKKFIHFMETDRMKADLFVILPLCLLICLGVFFATKHHFTVIQQQESAEQDVYFKKYEGNLSQHLSIPLTDAGLSKEETSKIITKLDTILNMNRLAPRDKYLLTLDENDQFKMLVVTKDCTRYYVAKNNGELVAGIMDISVKTRKRFASGTIGDSLFSSMHSYGLKAPFIVDFARVFSWTIDFNTETRAGDTFSCYWEEEYTADGRILDSTILAAYYNSKIAGVNYAIRFDDKMYDENGKMSKKLFLKGPISFRGVRITSRFTLSRFHPILRICRPHLGIDYAAPIGTPVETVADGTVIFKGHKGGFGNYMEVAHAGNYVTCYGHLSRFANFGVGSRVRQGQTIAYVGMTGLATGPHLDFRLRQNGVYMDFLKNKNRGVDLEVPKSRRAEFNKIRKEYLKILNEKAIKED